MFHEQSEIAVRVVDWHQPLIDHEEMNACPVDGFVTHGLENPRGAPAARHGDVHAGLGREGRADLSAQVHGDVPEEPVYVPLLNDPEHVLPPSGYRPRIGKYAIPASPKTQAARMANAVIRETGRRIPCKDETGGCPQGFSTCVASFLVRRPERIVPSGSAYRLHSRL
jgi:hypothetical protein